ncbi:hypothetical protein FRC03_009901 [Tulasnella sp. 419]|nr:hypothetical protein FRC03_009901 [Tulasnella sp. 419]
MATPSLAPTQGQDGSKEHDEDVKELDYQLEPSKSPSFGRPSTIGLAALSSLAVVLFWSFGMGSVLLVWLLVKRVDPSHPPGSLSNHCDATKATMTGVVIISAVTGFSSIAVVPLMGLGAFYVASQLISKLTKEMDLRPCNSYS